MKMISEEQLKQIRRDLDACQKVIWLAGGFDPAYCEDAQASLKVIDSILAAPNAQGAAADEKTNARGEPEAIYLQLHDPDEFDTLSVADYKAEVTWCWHKINGNDVRYIREDLAQGASVPEGWLPIESIPFNTPVLVSDEKIIASMFFYRPEESHRAEDQFNGGGWEGVRVSLIKNGCYSKLKWWRPMLEIPNENTVTSPPLTPKE